MGNYQFSSASPSLQDFEDNQGCLIASISIGEERGANIHHRNTNGSAKSTNQKVECDFCQEEIFQEFSEQHQRICQYNPDNFRVYFASSSTQNLEAGRRKAKPELEKVLCEYCDEPCYIQFQRNHKRICLKNPENMKVNCRFCNRTLNQILYNCHLSECERSYQQRRRSVESGFRSRQSSPNRLAPIRKVKTALEIEMEPHLNQNRRCCSGSKESLECPICLDNIKSNFEMSTLTCGHQFHRHCLDNWSRVQRKCPNCRKEFL